MDVTVDHVVIPLPQNFAETVSQGGGRVTRATVDPRAELDECGSVQAGVCAESAKVKLKIRDVEVAGEIEQPGFDAAGIEGAEAMEDFEWRRHAGGLDSGRVEATWE